MTERLPTYAEAITPPHWILLVAPYISIGDYASLCLVSRLCYRIFAPRLWNDPLLVIRHRTFVGGAEPLTDQWDAYFSFLEHVRDNVCAFTRCLVYSLDFRHLLSDSDRLIGSFDDFRHDEEAWSLRALPTLFPALRCIVADHRPSFDLTHWVNSGGMQTSRPRLLSLAQSQCKLPERVLGHSFLEDIMYLDISGVARSVVRKLFSLSSSSSPSMSSLRVLKCRACELDDGLANSLFENMSRAHLWSIDLRDNNLTDEVVPGLARFCSPPSRRLRPRRDEQDGHLRGSDVDSADFGPFCQIRESPASRAAFGSEQSRPSVPALTMPLEYYFCDAPAYQSDDHSEALRRTRRRDDLASWVKLLSGVQGYAAPEHPLLDDDDFATSSGGVTHLYLSRNRLSSFGLDRLMRSLRGQLELLDCGSLGIELPGANHGCFLTSAKVSGTANLSHLFRPAFSPHLRSLRIHHSLVTSIPTLHSGLPTMDNIWIAEKCLRESFLTTFPIAYIPNMNPVLESLTLTHMPRYSTGPLIRDLIGLFEHVSLQERRIAEAKALCNSTDRSPAVVRGLRHIRLEFDPDPQNEPPGQVYFGLPGLRGARQPSNPSSDIWEGWSSRISRPSPRLRPDQAPRALPIAGNLPPLSLAMPGGLDDHFTRRLALPPYDILSNTRAPCFKDEFIPWEVRCPRPPDSLPESERNDHTLLATDQVQLGVWLGSGIEGPHPAVNAYMAQLTRRALFGRPGPVTPAHVLAGCPDNVEIFHDAWDAGLVPRLIHFPDHSEARPDSMFDVVEELKRYRLCTLQSYHFILERRRHYVAEGVRNPGPLLFEHDHFTGDVQLCLTTDEAFHASEYWR